MTPHIVGPEEAAFAAELAGLGRRMGPALLADLRAAHDRYGFGCSAASEGLACCLDYLAAACPGDHPADPRGAAP